MFDAEIETIERGRVTRYQLTRNAEVMTFLEVLDLWRTDGNFRRFYAQLLAESSFDAYRWETPALTTESAAHPFEFVLLNAPRFCHRKTDPITYRNYFTADDTDFGVVSFANLSGDATLIVPSPRTEVAAYGHLAAFLRRAPAPQVEAFWCVVSRTITPLIGDRPRWLSTAGGGVAWLHARVDSRPKYYGYEPYRRT